MTVVVEEFRPVVKNNLRGFARCRFESGLIIAEIGIFVTDGIAWASPPAKPLYGADGLPLKDLSGKNRYQPFISFTSKAVRNNWSAQVVTAVREAHPEALTASEHEAAA